MCGMGWDDFDIKPKVSGYSLSLEYKREDNATVFLNTKVSSYSKERLEKGMQLRLDGDNRLWTILSATYIEEMDMNTWKSPEDAENTIESRHPNVKYYL